MMSLIHSLGFTEGDAEERLRFESLNLKDSEWCKEHINVVFCISFFMFRCIM